MGDLWFEITFWVGEHRRLAALLALTAITAGIFFAVPKFISSESGEPAGVTFTMDGGSVEKPFSVQVGKQRGAYKLKWQSWGANSATATGKLLVTSCNRRCTSRESKATVVARQLIDCGASKQYARLVVKPVKGKRITVANADPTCRS
jgi:hypothetical protein